MRDFRKELLTDIQAETSLSRTEIENNLVRIFDNPTYKDEKKREILGRFEQITPEQKSGFVKSPVGLWEIKNIGENVEKSDQKLCGATDTIQVPPELNTEVKTQYMNIRLDNHDDHDWFVESGQLLVEAVTKTIAEEAKASKNSCLGRAAKYMLDLESVGKVYEKVADLVTDDTTSYLKVGKDGSISERQKTMDSMRVLFKGTDLIISNLKPFEKTE